MLSDSGRDVRQVARGLLRRPGLLVGAVLSLGVGIGLNSAIFSVINYWQFKRLPVPQAERLVEIGTIGRTGGSEPVTRGDYLQYRAATHTLVGLATSGFFPATGRTVDGPVHTVAATLVSDNFFDVLGVRPALGRFFAPEETRTPGTHPVVVLSDAYWRGRLNADPSVIGGTLILNSHPYTVIGVTPPGFEGAVVGFGTDVFTSLMMRGWLLPGAAPAVDASTSWGRMVGRMRPGVGKAAVHSEFSALFHQLAASQRPDTAGDVVQVEPLRGVPRRLDGGALRFLLFPLGLAALVLLVACGNVASMLLTRAVERQREIAIRLSLGAHRGALLRQLLLESVLLALLSGAAGYLLASAGAQLLRALFEYPARGANLMRVAWDFSPDLRVLAFTLGVAMVCVLLFGLAPAFQATRPDLVRALHSGTPRAGSRTRLRSAIVVMQTAFAVPMIFSGSVIWRTVLSALHEDPGLTVDGVIVASVSAFPPRYEDAARRELFDRLEQGLQATPLFASVALASSTLLGSASAQLPVRLPGEPPPEKGAERQVLYNAISPQLSRLVGMRVLRGRSVQASDGAGAPAIALVNETMAKLWPGGNALGQHFLVKDRDYEVVGVVADAKYAGDRDLHTPYLFLSWAQRPNGYTAEIYARPHGNMGSGLPAIRGVVRDLDPDLQVNGGGSLAGVVASLLWTAQLYGVFVGLPAILTLLLAAIGAYALLANAVTQRRREIGVRMAVGAQAGDVLAMVVRQGVLLVVLGMAIGLPAGFWGLHVLRA